MFALMLVLDSGVVCREKEKMDRKQIFNKTITNLLCILGIHQEQ